MLVAGLVFTCFVGLLIFLLVSNAASLPRPFLKYFGYWLLCGSFVELLLLIWIVGYAWVSDSSLWSLSLDIFWKEQLTSIYFVKEWLYTWFWNDAMNFFFVFLPAVVFLSIRTTITSVLGFWALSASRR